jgi:hypothetical protein
MLKAVCKGIYKGCEAMQFSLRACGAGLGIVSVASGALAGIALAFGGGGYAQGAMIGFMTGGHYTTMAGAMAPGYFVAGAFLFKVALVAGGVAIILLVASKVVEAVGSCFE